MKDLIFFTKCYFVFYILCIYIILKYKQLLVKCCKPDGCLYLYFGNKAKQSKKSRKRKGITSQCFLHHKTSDHLNTVQTCTSQEVKMMHTFFVLPLRCVFGVWQKQCSELYGQLTLDLARRFPEKCVATCCVVCMCVTSSTFSVHFLWTVHIYIVSSPQTLCGINTS